MNPLVKLQEHGQSFWYDNITRRILQDGTLEKMIKDDGLRGMTSNPSIFEKSIRSGDDYDEQISQLAADGANATEAFEAVALADIRTACDHFKNVYESTRGGDGYVSLEVSPLLAHDTEGTIAEVRRLFKNVDRKNVMIKVPATEAGIPAIRQLIGEGININITLMFSMDHYEAVAHAYLDGLHHLEAQGGDVTTVASVASFFVSRVDSAVDEQLAALESPAAKALRGEIAVANSKVVYQRFKEIFHGSPFETLRSNGASVQRLLWASTSTKNPDYPDTLYVDSLIGPETVNTMPQSTIESFRDHGTVESTLDEDVDQARYHLKQLAEIGIDLDQITEQLQADGVEAFAESYRDLLKAVEEKIEREGREATRTPGD